MKRLLAMLVVVAFGTTVAFAGEKAAAEPTEMTIKGKLEKVEKTSETVKISYALATEEHGKVKLPKTEVKLDELVGQNVEMVVKAVVKEGKNKAHLSVKEVVSASKIEEVEAPEAPKVE